METNQNELTLEAYAFIDTHKVGTTGHIPFTNGFIETTQTLKYFYETRDSTDIPVIHGSTAIIVETNSKGEPPLSSLYSPGPNAQVKNFAYP